MKKVRLGILASGKGSNLQAIIDAIERNELPAEIACVLSDVEDAFALERARRHNVKAIYIPPGHYKTILTPEAERNYIDTLKGNKVELVILAGFMRVIKKNFIDAFRNRILNIHPSLLPAFPGMESWKQALEHGAKVTGVTVHFVDEGVDTGPIILQESVPILDSDTPQTLHNRIQKKEHILFTQAIRFYAEERIEVVGRRVLIKK